MQNTPTIMSWLFVNILLFVNHMANKQKGSVCNETSSREHND